MKLSETWAADTELVLSADAIATINLSQFRDKK